MKWKQPPVIKIYEALGALGDGRIEVEGNKGKVYSSSRGKYYEVVYSADTKAIVANDNGSYWQKYLGYPSISFLLAKGIVRHDRKWEEALKDIAWKDINTKMNNDFVKTEQYVRNLLVNRGYQLSEFDEDLKKIQLQIQQLALNVLGPIPAPPQGY